MIRMEGIMKKDTRIIFGICIVFIVIAVFLFGKQQKKNVSVSQNTVAELADNFQTELPNHSSKPIAASSEEECAVYVSGAVKKPCLFRYHGTARVDDAIQAAHGFQKDAAKDSINLARVLNDGEQICVLTKKQARKSTVAKADTASEKSQSDNKQIDINKATLEELMTLPGIGQAKAQMIITYRTEEGSFAKKEDLMKISGIKEGVYHKIKDLITIT